MSKTSFAELELVKKKSDELNETISNASSKASLHSIHSKTSVRSKNISLGKKTSWASVRSHLSQKDFKNKIDQPEAGLLTHGICEKGFDDHQKAEKSESKLSKNEEKLEKPEKQIKPKNNKIQPSTEKTEHDYRKEQMMKKYYNQKRKLAKNEKWWQNSRNRPKILAAGIFILFVFLIATDSEETETNVKYETCFQTIPSNYFEKEIIYATCAGDMKPINLNSMSSSQNPLILNDGEYYWAKMKGEKPTISGKGTGGNMAILMHTIYSKTFKGVASINGQIFGKDLVEKSYQEYWNSEFSLTIGFGEEWGEFEVFGDEGQAGMKNIDFDVKDVYKSIKLARGLEKKKNGSFIDKLENLRNSKVYIISGTPNMNYEDRTATVKFGRTLEQFYQILSCFELNCRVSDEEGSVPELSFKDYRKF